MSKRKFSSYFCSKRSKETEEDIHLEEWSVKEDDGDMNPKVEKTSNKSCNFLDEMAERIHIVTIQKPSHILSFLSLRQTEKSFCK